MVWKERGMGIDISVLIPSRKRVGLLDASIFSMIEKSHNPQTIEFMIACDPDDQETYEYGQQMGYSTWMTGERYGYKHLYEYYNLLASKSRGNWLFQWNDDALMVSENWDTKIYTYDHRNPLVLCPTGDMNIFPIVSKVFYNILGHLSLQAHTDTWIQDVSRLSGMERRIEGIEINHIRWMLNDETNQESQATYAETSPHFYTDEIQNLIREDANKINEWLQHNKTA